MEIKEVGAYEAKTHLSALLDFVEEQNGEVIITRHGKRVARLSKENDVDTEHVRKIFEAMERLSANKTLGDGRKLTFEEKKAMIEEGRR